LSFGDVQGVTGSKASTVTAQEQLDYDSPAGSQQIARWKRKLWLVTGSNAKTNTKTNTRP
jgi:hypothetical protein